MVSTMVRTKQNTGYTSVVSVLGLTDLLRYDSDDIVRPKPKFVVVIPLKVKDGLGPLPLLPVHAV